MSTLREAAEKALETLTDSRIGRCDYMDGVEIYSDFNDAAEALRAELVKPDAPTVEDEPAPQMPEALRDSLQRRCVEWGVYWRAPDAHGVDLTHEQALELLRDALGVEVEIAAAPRPAPAEPQPERDFAAEVDHWMKRSKEWRKRAEAAESAVSEFHHAMKDAGWHPGRTDDSLPDIIRAKGAELRAAPAPQPAGGEREAPADILTRLRNTPNWMRESYGSWKDCVLKYDRAPFEAAEEIERLRAALSQPAAQQDPVAWMWQHPETGMTGFVEHASPDDLAQWERMNRPRKIVTPLYTQAEERKPLTKGRNERAIFQAGRDSYDTPCQPMNTDDEAWEAYKRAHGITATKGGR